MLLLGFTSHSVLPSREHLGTWHQPSEGECANYLPVSLKREHSNDCGLQQTHPQAPKQRHRTANQQGGVLFSSTLLSIRPDWKRWLILSTCCQNVEGQCSHSTLLGCTEALRWCSTKPSEADSRKVGKDSVAFSPNQTYLLLRFRMCGKAFPSVSMWVWDESLALSILYCEECCVLCLLSSNSSFLFLFTLTFVMKRTIQYKVDFWFG